jgi:hypothetical protein
MGILKRAVRRLLGRGASKRSTVSPTNENTEDAISRLSIQTAFSRSPSGGALRNHDRALAQREAAEAIHGHDFAP